MKNLKFKEITIIGPGLIGASLGLILKNKKITKKIVGIDISKKNIKDAIDNKSIDEGRLKIDKEIFDILLFIVLFSFIGILITGERSNTIKAFFGITLFFFITDFFNWKAKTFSILLLFIPTAVHEYKNKKISTRNL